MYGKFSKSKGKRRAPLRRATKSSTRVVKKAVYAVKKRRFAKAVKRVINRSAETKIVSASNKDRPIYNAKSASFSGQVYNLIPQASGTTGQIFTISQGDTQSSREGNQVMPVGLRIHGVLRCNQTYNDTTNYNPCPLRVCLWVVKLKPHLTDDLTSLDNVVKNSFFENGSGSSGMDGTNLDLIRQPNKAHITLLYKRVFKLGMGNYVSSLGSGVVNNLNQQYNNNDFPMTQMFKINLSKYLPKKFVFNDATDAPTNTRRMYMFYSVHRADNAIPVTNYGVETGPVPAFLDIEAQMYFKDY